MTAPRGETAGRLSAPHLPGHSFRGLGRPGFAAFAWPLFPPADVTVSVSGLTIANGSSDKGGGIFNQGTLMLQQTRVEANHVYRLFSDGGFGGGIWNGGSLEI